MCHVSLSNTKTPTILFIVPFTVKDSFEGVKAYKVLYFMRLREASDKGVTFCNCVGFFFLVYTELSKGLFGGLQSNFIKAFMVPRG